MNTIWAGGLLSTPTHPTAPPASKAGLRAKKKIQPGCLRGDELDGALAGDEVVVDYAADGDHSEAAILDLGKLHARLVLALGEACGRAQRPVSSRVGHSLLRVCR